MHLPASLFRHLVVDWRQLMPLRIIGWPTGMLANAYKECAATSLDGSYTGCPLLMETKDVDAAYACTTEGDVVNEVSFFPIYLRGLLACLYSWGLGADMR